MTRPELTADVVQALRQLVERVEDEWDAQTTGAFTAEQLAAGERTDAALRYIVALCRWFEQGGREIDAKRARTDSGDYTSEDE